MKAKKMAIVCLASMLIAVCMIIPAVVAQPTPVLIYGSVFDTGNDPVYSPNVTITNLDTGNVFTAETNENSNYYQIVLANSSDVKEGDRLRITAKKVTEDDLNKYHPNSSTYIVSVTEHNVTLDNITAGGVFNANLTLDEFCIHYNYPYEVNHDLNYSGAAVMKMWANFKNVTAYDQIQLQAMGRANNSNLSRPYYVDPMGLAKTLKGIIPLPSGHTFTVGVMPGDDEGLNWAMHRICWWQWTGPGALPAKGYYANWMAVRGIHTDEDPHSGGGFYGYNVSGFWINDPNSTGIGENSYKTADEWTTMYYKVITDPYYSYYDGKYITVLEPPEHEADVRIVPAKPRLNKTITPVMMQRAFMVDGIETMALEKATTDGESLEIVKAAIDGLTEELIPYDDEFAAVFAKTVASEPILVSADNGDYYLVPFVLPVKKIPIPIREPVEIQRFDGARAELIKAIDGNALIEPIPIKPLKVERTLIVVIVDAEDGSFKEASWVADPVKYLPVSKADALKLVFDVIGIPKTKPAVELVNRAGSPYYPDWKITVDGKVFFVSQDGTLSYDEPLPTHKPGPIRIMPI